MHWPERGCNWLVIAVEGGGFDVLGTDLPWTSCSEALRIAGHCWGAVTPQAQGGPFSRTEGQFTPQCLTPSIS